MSLMAIMLMIVVMVIMMITQMINENENAKLGGRWSTAKERKDWKKERWLQSGRS